MYRYGLDKYYKNSVMGKGCVLILNYVIDVKFFDSL